MVGVVLVRQLGGLPWHHVRLKIVGVALLFSAILMALMRCACGPHVAPRRMLCVLACGPRRPTVVFGCADSATCVHRACALLRAPAKRASFTELPAVWAAASAVSCR